MMKLLITPTPEHDFRHPYNLFENVAKKLTANQVEALKSIIFAKLKGQLIEPDLNKLFDLIIFKNIPSMALTAMGTWAKVNVVFLLNH